MKPGGEDVVLLLHGLGRFSTSWLLMRRALEAAGYRALPWGYASASHRFEVHGERLRERLRELDEDASVARVHAVTHSLGGIVVRHALTLERPRKIGRVVMLAPPNKGSRIARTLAPWLARLLKPLPQLSDDPASDVNRLPPPAPGLEWGVIAAASDGKVRVEDTHLPGEKDHLVVPGYHTFIMNRADVRGHVVRFLAEGRFQGSAPPRR